MTLPPITDLFALVQIILIDLAMAGDNAIAVGMAAAGLPPQNRHKAVWAGICAATLLRIGLACFATQLLHITGLMVAGGLLLLWVVWKMYRDLRHQMGPSATHSAPQPQKTVLAAMIQIVVADLSMSLDNVLAVAGVARDHMTLLVIGLTLSVFLMGVVASIVARLIARYPWIAYIAMAAVLYAALHMIWDGAQAVWPKLI